MRGVIDRKSSLRKNANEAELPSWHFPPAGITQIELKGLATVQVASQPLGTPSTDVDDVYKSIIAKFNRIVELAPSFIFERARGRNQGG